MPAHLTVHFAGVPAPTLAALTNLSPTPTGSADGAAQACELFGLHGAALPIAAITFTYDFGAPPAGWCARLDPVCLMPSAATLRLLDLASAPLDEADARDLFARVSSADVIPQVQWRFGAPLRWYVLCADAPDIETVAPDALPGGDVAAGHPRGADARRWQGWLNELHMLLFDAAPNLAREARDLPPANGLWLWGGGTAPALAPAPFAAVWTDEPVVGGLARLAGLTPAPTPQAPDWLHDLPDGHSLVGLDASAAQPAHAAPWLDALQAALDRGRLQSVTLLAGGGTLRMRRRGLLGRLRQRVRPSPT